MPDIDPLTTKKLFLVKQLYQRAILNSNSSNSADKIIAIILFDLSTETMLNTILSALDPAKVPARYFGDLINQIDTLMTNRSLGNLPDGANILRVHDIRNDAQHDARDPSENDLSDCSTYTRNFLNKITNQVWSIDFQDIRLTDLIKNPDMRDYLIKAEESFQNEDYPSTVKNACIGFEKSLGMIEEPIVGRAPFFGNTLVVTDSFARDFKPSDEYTKGIENMRKTLSFLALNLNYMDYLKFKQITGIPLWSIGNIDPHDFINQKSDITKSDAEFVISFAINGIISMESKVGDLEKPFGIETR